MAGRKPVHLASAGPKPRGRQVVWETIRALGKFTTRQLSAAIDHDLGALRTYLDCLRAGGYIEIVDAVTMGARTTHIYQLVRDVGVEAPRLRADGTPVTQGLATEQMWRTLKILGDFSPRDLAIAASTEQQPVDDGHACDYVGHLHRAGYLQLVAAPTRVAQARYRFVRARNSGPKPPMVQRLKTVFDPNLGKIVWQEEPEE